MARPSSIKEGDVFTHWTVIKFAGYNEKKRGKYLCKCACGNIKEVAGSNLSNKTSKSCGICSNRRNTALPYQSLYNRIIIEARRRKKEIKLSFDEFLDFTLINKCHYCDCDVTWAKHNIGSGTGRSKYNLDRKDSSKGYIKSNLVVCCARCNWAKSNGFSYSEWKEIGNLISSWKDRDINAARNTLFAALGISVEVCLHAA